MTKKRLSFEKSLDTLEKIVEELEGGSLTLDEALERYERGMAAHKECAQILAAAEKRIEVLLKQDSGFETAPLDADGTEGGSAP
ncbi:MAG: exodeoxyribonuclease VII small subunit [Candidatus Brocadiae bacterium]|nr:exodeoxyribonuclease VII small subunit [Candidatus Brocadiia bacterium]